MFDVQRLLISMSLFSLSNDLSDESQCYIKRKENGGTDLPCPYPKMSHQPEIKPCPPHLRRGAFVKSIQPVTVFLETLFSIFNYFKGVALVYWLLRIVIRARRSPPILALYSLAIHARTVKAIIPHFGNNRRYE